MIAVRVRSARPEDIDAILGIYNWAVRNSTATMDTSERTPEEQKAWLDAHNGTPYPALVAELGGAVIGYASLSCYNAKPGYAGTTDNSIYVHPDWQGRGVGKALLSALIDEAMRREFVTIVALITAENEPSLQLHQRLGFTNIGTLRKVGRKFDRWLDVAFLQLILTPEKTAEASLPESTGAQPA